MHTCTNWGAYGLFSRLSWGKENWVPDECSRCAVDRHGARCHRSSIRRKVWQHSVGLSSPHPQHGHQIAWNSLQMEKLSPKRWTDPWMCPLGWPNQIPATPWRKGWSTGTLASLTKTPAGTLGRRRLNPLNAFCARNPSQRSVWRSLWSTVTSATTRPSLCRSWWVAWAWPKKKVTWEAQHDVCLNVFTCMDS